MDKFLERHKLPKLIQEERYSRKPYLFKDTEFVFMYFPTKTTPSPDGFTQRLYHTKEEVVTILHNWEHVPTGSNHSMRPEFFPMKIDAKMFDYELYVQD